MGHRLPAHQLCDDYRSTDSIEVRSNHRTHPGTYRIIIEI
jgi:hypothetical protein